MSPDSPPPDLNAEPPEMSRTKKIVWVACTIAVVVVLGLVVHARIAAHRNAPNFVRGAGPGFGAPLAVGVAQVTQGDVPVTIDSLGTVTPLATVTVHPQVTGPLVKIDFSEGQMVKAGDVLAEIDPRPFQATVDQAQGQLEHDQALLANARVDLDRYKTLVAQNSVAEQTYATQQATVLQDEATLVADKAALEADKLNLSYCRITSPVGGSVGLRQVDVGNVVSAYSSSIVVVTQLQPMSVLYTVPEDNLSEVLQRMRHGDMLVVDAYDRTFTTKLDSGVLANSDNEVDTTTGTLKLRAMFNNSQGQLFPDQFVNVRMTLDTLHSQLLVPGSAVQNGASGTFVYIVDQSDDSNAPADPSADPSAPGAQGGPGAAAQGAPNGRRRRGFGGGFGGGGGFPGGFVPAGPIRTVHVQYVTTGPSVGNFISIPQGLQLGEIVVVDGAEQLRDGARVTMPNPPESGSPSGASGTDGSNSGAASGAAAAGADPSPAAGAAAGAAASGYGSQRFPGYSGAPGAHRGYPGAFKGRGAGRYGHAPGAGAPAAGNAGANAGAGGGAAGAGSAAGGSQP